MTTLPAMSPKSNDQKEKSSTMPSSLMPKRSSIHTERLINKNGSIQQYHAKGDGDLLNEPSMMTHSQGALPTLKTVLLTGGNLVKKQATLKQDLRSIHLYDLSATAALKVTASDATFSKAEVDGLRESNEMLRQRKAALLTDLQTIEGQIGLPGPKEKRPDLDWTQGSTATQAKRLGGTAGSTISSSASCPLPLLVEGTEEGDAAAGNVRASITASGPAGVKGDAQGEASAQASFPALAWTSVSASAQASASTSSPAPASTSASALAQATYSTATGRGPEPVPGKEAAKEAASASASAASRTASTNSSGQLPSIHSPKGSPTFVDGKRKPGPGSSHLARASHSGTNSPGTRAGHSGTSSPGTRARHNATISSSPGTRASHSGTSSSGAIVGQTSSSSPSIGAGQPSTSSHGARAGQTGRSSPGPRAGQTSRSSTGPRAGQTSRSSTSIRAGQPSTSSTGARGGQTGRSSPGSLASHNGTRTHAGLYKFPIRQENIPVDYQEQEGRLQRLTVLRDKLQEVVEESHAIHATSCSDLKQRFSQTSASTAEHKELLQVLKVAKADAESRLRHLQRKMLGETSSDLNMTLKDNDLGASHRTRAIIESALNDRARKGRMVLTSNTPGCKWNGSSFDEESRSSRWNLGITGGSAVACGSSNNSQSPSRAESDDFSSKSSTRGNGGVARLKSISDETNTSTASKHKLHLLGSGIANFEQLAPIKRLMLLQQLSSQFTKMGGQAASMHQLMSSSARLNNLHDKLGALEHLVELAKDMLHAEDVRVYKVHEGQYWCVSMEEMEAKPVERGVVSFAAQSATLLQTDALRKCFAYHDESEDIKVPNNPATPALIMPVRDAAAPIFPVPGVIPSRLVLKAVGKNKTGPTVGSKGASFNANDVSTMRTLCGLLGWAMGNWDTWDGMKDMVSRYTALLERSRLLLNQLEHNQLFYALAEAAADTADAEQGVLYLVDRARNELVGHMTKDNGEKVQFRTSCGGVLSQVMNGGRSRAFLDLRHNLDFIPGIDSPPHYPASSMVLAPIFPSNHGKPIGLLQVLNKCVSKASSLYPAGVRANVFEDVDADLLQSLASMATSCLSFSDHVRSMTAKHSMTGNFQAGTLAEGARKMSILIRDQLQCENVRFFTCDAEKDLNYLPAENCYFPRSDGIAGQVAVTGKTHNFVGARALMAEQHLKERASENGVSRSPSISSSQMPLPKKEKKKPGRRGRNAFPGDEIVEPCQEQYDEQVDGAGHSPWCTLGVPITDPNTRQVFATLQACNKRGGHRFTDADVKTLKSFCGQASLVAMNSEANQKLERCHDFSSGLQRFAERMAATLDYKGLGMVVESSVKTMLGLTTCALLLTMTEEDLLKLDGQVSNANEGLSSKRQGSVLMMAAPTILDALSEDAPSHLYCIAEAASDGFGRPELTLRATPVVLSKEAKLLIEGNLTTRDEYTGKIHPLHFSYTVPLIDTEKGKCMGVMIVERKGVDSFSDDEKLILDAVTCMVVAKLKAGCVQFSNTHREIASTQEEAPEPANDESPPPLAARGLTLEIQEIDTIGTVPTPSPSPFPLPPPSTLTTSTDSGTDLEEGSSGLEEGGTGLGDGGTGLAEEAQKDRAANVRDGLPLESQEINTIGAVPTSLIDSSAGLAGLASSSLVIDLTVPLEDIGEGGEESRPVTASYAVRDPPKR